MTSSRAATKGIKRSAGRLRVSTSLGAPAGAAGLPDVTFLRPLSGRRSHRSTAELPSAAAWLLGAHAGREFAYISIQDLFDATGNFQGTLKVRWRIILAGGDEFVGVANPQIRDAAGNITLDACSKFRGERIDIEALSPRCQNITPPQ